jgi:uncharacterized protein with PQ loop repeat
MGINVPVIAGGISTVIFALSTLPMLVKAVRTKDLGSYSLGNIMLANVGNAIHSIYVFSLPAGPVWVLHSFYVISTGLMLFWYVRYAWRGRRGGQTMILKPDGRYAALGLQDHAAGPGIRTITHVAPAAYLVGSPDAAR